MKCVTWLLDWLPKLLNPPDQASLQLLNLGIEVPSDKPQTIFMSFLYLLCLFLTVNSRHVKFYLECNSSHISWLLCFFLSLYWPKKQQHLVYNTFWYIYFIHFVCRYAGIKILLKFQLTWVLEGDSGALWFAPGFPPAAQCGPWSCP